MDNDSIDTPTNNSKVISIISYMTAAGWIIAYLINNPRSEKASFHLRQSLGINLLLIASGILFAIPILGWVAGIIGYILGGLLWVLGLLYAIDGETKEVPILGNFFQEWFMAV